MGIKQRLTVTAILPFMFMYAVFGRQEVPSYSSWQWWPTFTDLAFVGSILIIVGMLFWNIFISRFTKSDEEER